MFRNQYDQVNLNFAALIWIINLPSQGCADVESAGAFAPDRMCVQFLKLFFISLSFYLLSSFLDALEAVKQGGAVVGCKVN